MAKTDYSVADLEKMLEQRQKELSALEAKRDQLSADLSDVEKEIADLVGKSMPGKAPSAPKKTVKKKKVVKKKKTAARGRRAKNAKPLKGYILDVLAANKKGLTISGVMDKVVASGYKTNSSAFKTVVYQNLYHMKKAGKISHNEKTGLYKPA
ncbi:hypothetical protein [Calycomorphotria hydatis]|uniref:Uncharacterized protein n=1 Tax=Calycomorphotria hydatis TaxID=2528027 RepID=A0A517TD18_9PLAN|nr:hypothetical protein [Calycomorphotria hydatis]QDT66264.1 hypothetical protein V22_35290 [Calycomorphotria hydatis]